MHETTDEMYDGFGPYRRQRVRFRVAAVRLLARALWGVDVPRT